MGRQDSNRFCHKCGAQLRQGAHFCSECGTELSLRHKLSGMKKRLQFRTQEKIDNLKQNIDMQISQYLRQFDNNEPVTIGSVTVPQSRRTGVENAMRSFQDKYLEGSPNQTSAYDEWVRDLPNRLEDHKCIVCFSSWSPDDQDDIIVCPHCNTGGHRSHIENWIRQYHYCPLCRSEVTYSQFIQIV